MYKQALIPLDGSIVAEGVIPFILQIAGPLVEVRDRVAEELARRESNDALVPIDRDPVPPQFSELVRRYYEQLGKSE